MGRGNRVSRELVFYEQKGFVASKHHEGKVITPYHPDMRRRLWSTCAPLGDCGESKFTFPSQANVCKEFRPYMRNNRPNTNKEMLGYTFAKRIKWLILIVFFSFQFLGSDTAQPNKDIFRIVDSINPVGILNQVLSRINGFPVFYPQTRNLVFFPSSQGCGWHNARFLEIWFVF